MQALGVPQPRDAVALCLAVSGVNRVKSILTIYFGRMHGLRNTDRFDVEQGVELIWRELSGLPRAVSLRRELTAWISDEWPALAGSALPGTAAASAAVAGISVLLDESLESLDKLRQAWGRCLEVAINFDLLGVQVPPGHASWASYELRGQAELMESLPLASDSLSEEAVFDIQMKSGADSPRTRMFSGLAPASLAVLIASVTMLAAPLAEPAHPACNRTPASTGAAVGVQIVTANGDRPRRRTDLPAIFVWPNDAPCLVCPYTGRSNESMSMKARSPLPWHGGPLDQGD